MKNTKLAAILAVLAIILVTTGFIAFLTNQSQMSSSGTTNATSVTSSQTHTLTSTSGISSTVAISFKSSIGSFLTNGPGFTLYIFLQDTPNGGTSACNGSCATLWPPFFTSHLAVPSGLSASSFGTITRTDGSKQITFNGHPLYLFTPDKAPGQTNGQGFGGVWFVASPQGTAATTTTAAHPGY